MIKIEALRWFKETFGPQMQDAVNGTPFSVDLLVAVAAQETGTFWAANRNKLPLDQLLELCVGDTLDENRGRRAFPRTHAHLLQQPRGDQMLAIGHQALVAVAQHVPDYLPASKNRNKFCHGYGVFQYDLQFFLTDPDYFLERRWRSFPSSLGKCLEELTAAAKRLRLADGHKLNDMESVAVAIAYNSGRFIPSKGLKQGFESGGRFYGENINDYLRISQTIETPQLAAPVPEPQPGTAALPPPSAVTPEGDVFVVDVTEARLNVRSEPKIDKNKPAANVIATLPDGQRVRRISGSATDKFLEIETSLNGALIRGFSSTKFLVKEAGPAAPISVATPAPELPTSGVVAVFAPRKDGQITRRTSPAGALSLNETDMPTRSGTSPDELRQELWDIVDYLAVDKASHVRYQPVDGRTFCNIYAHDFCTLAGVYFPRCWWTGNAIERLARGDVVEARLGTTISEQRANDLFDWLRAFGLRFGWRQTGTLTKLQNEANLGAVALVIAKRKEEGKPGHVTMVVPERGALRARRDTAGEVIVPLQSQAGASNFQFGTSTGAWWTAARFSDAAFWVHA